eukprot:SAG25_NODE_14727_length_251_cov_1.342105_1_plen_83_part_11
MPFCTRGTRISLAVCIALRRGRTPVTRPTAVATVVYSALSVGTSVAVVPLIHSSSGGWADSQASAAIAAYMIYQYTPHQERRE